ncbi:LysM peptidoglycan-binding domain-containing protein [Aeromicrobium ginsengisoli]|uniref:LysM peptidoglycan-binding domain-containing protein n=1 Tax=Aeromicrobium ginsengisoli TaxID=363867 RepID=A0A5M4FJ57_9ACTN|nr:LysM domain-containing protein [Aeromicrobium ginsengisoli]KAA1400204.1 LysM peptidoglycan-binding domain-containing protein [Aeromicrobium ginsengisoli]
MLTTLAALSAALLTPSAGATATDLRGESFPDALLALGCVVQLALSTWVLLVAGLSLVRAPAPLLRAITPRLLRRALFAGTAGALALAPVPADRGGAPGRPQHDLTGLQLPDRPIGAATVGRAAPRVSASPVVVRPGDTLWAIAARSLPRHATAAEVARACAQWHAANRDVIGDDPDLIFPTQRLVPPLGKDPT